MKKNYVIWWHSKFIDEIDRSGITIAEIVNKLNTINTYLEKLKHLEQTKKIKIKITGSLNPIYIDILDSSVESEVAQNPLVEILNEKDM